MQKEKQKTPPKLHAYETATERSKNKAEKQRNGREF
jgi:hypothetical protein